VVEWQDPTVYRLISLFFEFWQSRVNILFITLAFEAYSSFGFFFFFFFFFFGYILLPYQTHRMFSLV
jgi:hypothetical protein